MIHSSQIWQEQIIYRFLILLAVFPLSACALDGKHYSLFDNLRFLGSFQNSEFHTRTADETVANRYAWWENYDDPALNLLIDKMLANNLDLKIAAERTLQAKENITIARSSLLPSLSVNGNGSRQATPANAGGFANIGQTDTFYNNNYNLGLDAQWQIDLFGEVRNNIDSRTASYLSVQANKDALIQSLITQMVEARVSLGNLNARRNIVLETIKTRKKTLEAINRRYELGISTVDALQVRLARENFTNAQAQLPPIESAIKDVQYAIDLLIGQMPDSDIATYQSNLGLLPPPDKLALPPPVAILDMRPDLRVQEYRLMAANKDINVALADLFPSLSISGGYGFQAQQLGDLIDVDAIAWNVISNLMQPLFEGGRIKANIRLQESEARELAAEYSKSILNAVREVESALQTEENLYQQLELLNQTNDEASQAFTLGQTRYQKGLINLTDLLDIERRVLGQKLQILEVQQAIWQTRLQLYLATGGNWLSKDGTYDPALPLIKTENLDRA